MGNLSRNFSIEEFTDSVVARARKIDNTIPTLAIKNNIEALVKDVLQPLRDAWGKSLTINSGFRSKALNLAVGGSASSQHMKGEAADVRCLMPFQLAKMAKDLDLPFDQMILYPTFVHFSHKRIGTNRKQIKYNQSYHGERFR